MIKVETCAILSVGTEVVDGTIEDTNTLFVLEKLKLLGIRCQGRYFLPDDECAIEKMVVHLKGEVDCIILCGGLGATPDDCTREALAQAIGRPLRIDHDHLEKQKDIYRGWGVPVPETSYKQTMVPEGSHLLKNTIGTAVGFAYSWDESILAVFPGVPCEMELMFEESFMPWLMGVIQLNSRFSHREFMLYGITETEVGEMLSSWMEQESNPSVGVYVSTGIIRVVLTAKGSTQEEAEQLAETASQEIHTKLSEWIYGENGISLQEVVVRELRKTNQQIILLEESGTDGLVSVSIHEFDLHGTYCVAGFIGALAVDKARKLPIVKDATSHGIFLVHISQLPNSEAAYHYNLNIQGKDRILSKVISIPLKMPGVRERVTKSALHEFIRFLQF